MVSARRSIAVFLASFGVLGLLFFPSTCIGYMSLPPSHSCETELVREPWAWLMSGSMLLVAAVLWSAPWRRLSAMPARERRLWIPMSATHRLRAVGGWVLLGAGGAVIFYSVAGLFRSSLECGWEIGCHELEFLHSGTYREGTFSSIRIAGVGFGTALLWWGILELRPGAERLARLAALGLGVAWLLVIASDPLGYGFRGFGPLQLIVASSVLAVTALVLFGRERHTAFEALAGAFERHRRNLLLAARSLAIILGAWVTVLSLTDPRCSGLVRCEHEVRPLSVLAVSVVGAGLYVAYERWRLAERRLSSASDPR